MFKNIGFSLILIFGLMMVACSPTVAARDTAPATNVTLDDSLAAKLRADGATVEVGDAISQPFFSPSGQILLVNGQEVQVFTYADTAVAEAEAAQVAPTGSSVGTNMLSWMATPHFYRNQNMIALYVGDDEATLAALERAFGPQFAGGQSGGSQDEIAAAVLAGLQAIGWDITGFEAKTEVVDGDYARAVVTSSNPPGGFTAFLQRQDGTWTLLAQGSAFNPAELQAMGIPDSVLGTWSATASSEDIGAAAMAGLEKIGWDVEGFSAEVTAVDGDYARVTISTTNPPGGFTAFMVRQAGEWTVAAHGSAFNPEELKTMGFPDSVLP